MYVYSSTTLTAPKKIPEEDSLTICKIARRI
jgi:hypothetical protein